MFYFYLLGKKIAVNEWDIFYKRFSHRLLLWRIIEDFPYLLQFLRVELAMLTLIAVVGWR